ncbi:MAG: hypothetical protein ACM3SR_06520 [Ignavibacteriales bacterium]
MNDPHVKRLYYKMVIDESVDYNKAPGITDETDQFRVTVVAEGVTFEMKEHLASEMEARTVAEDYLKRWAILIGLERRPDELQFQFERAEVIDRNPVPNDGKTVMGKLSINIETNFSLSAHVSRGKFPSLPSRFKASPDVETMYLRYNAYLQKRDILTEMAYMCLRVLEASSRGRKNASPLYHIDMDVLSKLGELSSKKGDRMEARKPPKNGVYIPLSSNERSWLEEAVKAMIRRVGERDYYPSAPLKRITMADLPKI